MFLDVAPIQETNPTPIIIIAISVVVIVSGIVTFLIKNRK